MATTRVMAAATSTSCTLILKRPPSFHSVKRSLSFTPTLSRKLFTCRAIHRPEDVVSKEHGQPETLDYRVFFEDNSGKKVYFSLPVTGFLLFF